MRAPDPTDRHHTRTALHALLSALLVACLAPAGCGGDDDPAPPSTEAPSSADATSAEPAPTTAEPTAETTPVGPSASLPPSLPDRDETVAIDPDVHFDPPGQGYVRAGQIEDAALLLTGEQEDARIGDFFLENDQARFIIGFGDRVIGPCSWDGNPIDAAPMRDGAQQTPNIMGEICLLMNVGQTIRPERVEILADGSDGRAIIAVTGRTAWLDFLSVRVMLDNIVAGFTSLIAFDLDTLLPLTVTVHYALSPDSDSLRVVSAFRSHATERIHFAATHLLRSGSTGSYFTPLGRLGFGYAPASIDSIDGDPVAFLTYLARHGSYTFLPDPQPHLDNRLPVAGTLVAIFGVATVTHGATSLPNLLLANPRRLDRTPGYIGLDPGEVATVGYRLFTGHGTMQSTVDRVYAHLDVPRADVSGTVLDADGQPRADVLVTAVEQENGRDARTLNQARTDADGRYRMVLPSGDYTLRARADGRIQLLEDITVATDDLALPDITLDEPARLTVRIRTPDGEPSPGRVTVECEDPCGLLRPDNREGEESFQAPLGWERIVFVGVDGETAFDLAPGRYRVHVSRGIAWSIWPPDTRTTRGHALDLQAGETATLDAEIAPVIDTEGALSADFHIHAMASFDSSVTNEDRVLDFLASNLHVMVSSDHDAITDFAPTIDALGANPHITSIVGSELTTPNLGHLNAFPLERDENARRGGPLDWSNEGGHHLTLAELAERLRHPTIERVFQMNHPATPGGAITLLNADVLTGQTFERRENLRMAPEPPDPVTGDTGLWSDDFTAIEVLNGHGSDQFWPALRWWMTMVARGFSPAATAVSDTHTLYQSLGASPRSWVFVPEGQNSPETMQTPDFVRAINTGRLLGTNGPFVTVEIVNSAGDTARIGDTLDITDGPATARIRVQTPEWMHVDTVDLYMNVEDDLLGEPGQALTHELDPTRRIPLQWRPDEHLVTVRQGEFEHRRWEQTVEVELDPGRDAWVVVLVRSRDGVDMRPVLATSAPALAFTNPVYLDADGGGYDNPPLADLAQTRQQIPEPIRFRHVSPRPALDTLTREDLATLLHALQCSHGLGEHDAHGHHHHGHGHGHGHHHHGHGHGHGHGHPPSGPDMDCSRQPAPAER
ncbi:MAG: carboxypeptidase regulatory-like domain-containing protein [Deltaproteobacteria bacterium]|nr:MAG: carboxypeptidase regulatory-like domain-containing protein [Deltaproteobacteria bacterium]